jgi:hypothetical protein
MTDPLAELKHIRRILKKRWHTRGRSTQCGGYIEGYQNRYHKASIYSFNPETLIALGEKTGFSFIRKRIPSLKGNISLVFQNKSGTLCRSVDLSNNYLKLSSTINRHTTSQHSCIVVPYKKFLENTIWVFTEMSAIIRCKCHKEIIETVVG